jgi:predicted transcriptional regulator
MQEKSVYTLRELYDNLPIPLKELGERARVNEVTVARIRDGKPARRSTINKLLREMGKPDVYNRSFSLENVTGVHIQGEARPREIDEDEAA